VIGGGLRRNGVRMYERDISLHKYESNANLLIIEFEYESAIVSFVKRECNYSMCEFRDISSYKGN
jgi:hypothetical protein